MAPGHITIRAAVFDWDGTLIDSRAALLAAWRAATTAVLGRPYPASAEEEDLVFTLPGARIWPDLVSDPAELPVLSERFQQEYERNAATVRAFPGVHAMLESLRAEGVAIGVVTSKARRRYDSDARHSGLAPLVDVAVCAEDARAPKPDPEPVRIALERLGAEPARAVMAGDTAVDVKAARAAGTRPLGVAWGHGRPEVLTAAGAEAVARSPAELAGAALRREPLMAGCGGGA
jgi:HAD superfamily hydrolase (TIGR01509 family)